MGVNRKSEQHNEDLVREIADSFNDSMRSKRARAAGEANPDDDSSDDEQRFVITGDQRKHGVKRKQ